MRRWQWSSRGCFSTTPSWPKGALDGSTGALLEQNTIVLGSVSDSARQSSVLDVDVVGGWAGPRYSHISGVFVPLKAPTGGGAWPDQSVVRIEFDAKRATGAAFLQIQRPWGGVTGNNVVNLQDNWTHHSFTLTLNYATSDLLLAPIPAATSQLTPIVPAHFQLDNLVVSVTPPQVSANPCDASNLFTNGCFASMSTGVERRIFTGSFPFLQDPIELAAEDTLALPGASPALRVRFRNDMPSVHSHQSGLYLYLTGPAPQADSVLRVEFDAKRISGASYLQLTRQWGGSSGEVVVPLSDTWQHHVMTVRSAHALDGLLLSPVAMTSTNLQVVQPAEFLIDNLVIKPAPSVLVIHRNHAIEPQVPQALEGKGLVVDAVTYTDLASSDPQKTRDPSKYNVLWVESLPAAGDPGPTPQAFAQLLNTHMANGGGVMITPSQPLRDAYRETDAWLRDLGANLTLEMLDVPSAAKRRPVRLSSDFFRTTSLAQSSRLTQGVSDVWFPVPFYNGSAEHNGPEEATGGSVVHDARWLPVLKAGADVYTQPSDLEGWPNYDESWAINVPRRCNAPDPTLLAVRDVGPGRVGLFRMLWSYHLSAGRGWAQDGRLLWRGFDSVPSHFEQLLANTLHWLAQPSWNAGTHRGALVKGDRFSAPLLKPGAAEPHVAETLQPVVEPGIKPLYRGVIGAQALTGETSSVDAYIDAVDDLNAQKPDFIVFLEDYAALGSSAAARIAALATECNTKSTSALRLFAGYFVPTNVGGKYFVYGASPPPPPAELMVNGQLVLQDVDGAAFLNTSRAAGYFYNAIRANNDANATSGMFGLSDSGSGLRLPFLKRMPSAGVKVYDENLAQTEDHIQDYLLTNSGASPLVPLAIQQVKTPEQLKDLMEAHLTGTDRSAPT